ncbi:2-dehydropantoate 2-reductase [Eremococcus coleocola]|uniref:2-dehydropantoate 2-reductase n=1 Tax=Eremococcus coleocola TaxID=88132 RepID=UPI000418C121|nr:2-dehydropantoate 2-reductase [Eremococcus coleocola]
MLIYIAGSGAMGCRFGAQLHEAGQEVILLDNWDDHINTIKENGLKISGDDERIVPMTIMKPQEANRVGDLIILFTKAMQLPAMLESIQGIMDSHTKVLCLLNGLGHEEVIKQYVPERSIIMGVTVWTAQLVGPGHVKLASTGSINIQSIDANEAEMGHKVAEILNEAKLNAIYDQDVIPSIWRKACVNGTMNSLCALLNCTIGQLFATEPGLQLVHEIIHEFVQVGQAEGVKLDEEAVTDYVMKTSVTAAHHYPSMHQDLVQNHRYTEIDFINGAVTRIGDKHDIETPRCDVITQLIHTKEKILIEPK